MSAFNIAWSLLKALPEYQSYEEKYYPTDTGYDQPTTQVFQQRRGTLSPAIARMMREQQEGSRFPHLFGGLDTRIRPLDTRAPEGRLQGYSIHPMDTFPDTAPTSGYEEADEYTGRHAQLQRGSVFDPRPVRFRSMIEHPPKQPFDPDEAAAYLQSIGF